MKRTCEGCRAFEYDGVRSRCNLQYDQDIQCSDSGWGYTIKPAEECPKPKTYDKYIQEVQKKIP